MRYRFGWCRGREAVALVAVSDRQPSVYVAAHDTVGLSSGPQAVAVIR